MTISWIAPAAFAGLALVALPIAIHLLVRQHARVLAYPSLRFLRETQLAALRRRTIQDAALLMCRIAIIAIAALALAGPVLQTAGRLASYSTRTSRAIVVLGSVDQSLVDRATEGAFASGTFTRVVVADALADAVRWLDRQPPSAREVVVIGELRRGVIDESDFAAIPASIGVRFVALALSSRSDQSMFVLTRRNGVLMRVEQELQLGPDSTGVKEKGGTALPDDLLTIVSAPGDAALADAALRAALDAGVPWADFDRRVVIAWNGADESRSRGQAGVVRMPVPSPPASAADRVREALMRISPPALIEPVAISGEQLARWTRPPGALSPDAPLSDEGDRRWLWGAVLVLMAIEWWVRRSASTAAKAVETAVEARVA